MLPSPKAVRSLKEDEADKINIKLRNDKPSSNSAVDVNLQNEYVHVQILDDSE